MADINLLPQEEKAAETFDLFRRRLTLASVLILFGTAVFTLVTLTMFTSFKSRRSGLIERVDEGSRQVNNLKANEELAVVVKKKAAAASVIIGSRTDTPTIFDKFAQLIPQGVYFTDLRFSEGKLVMSGKAKSTADISGFIGAVTSASGAEVVSNVTVDSLSADEQGVYSFVMSAELATR